MRIPSRFASLCLALPALAVAPLHAQGTLSTQGFGYPTGGLSTRATGTGGSFGEFDAISPLNPAAIGGVTRTVITAQVEPEFRSLSIGGVTERNRIQRIPLLLAVFPAPRRFVVSVSANSFLDRSYSSITTGEAVLGDETVATRDSYSVRGSMSMLRGAVARRINSRVAVGLAGHIVIGANDVAVNRVFEDSARFGAVNDTSKVEFQGSAISIGADVNLSRSLALAASYRLGNSIESVEFGNVQSKAKVPSRAGASLRYVGIRGSVFAAAVEQVSWSAMKGLGTADVDARDAFNWSLGAEVSGPSIRQFPVQIRAGFARNELPFGVGGRGITENRIGGGLGIPIGQDLVSFDLSVQRASRTMSGSPVRETGWMLGLGMQIRP